MLLLFSFQWQIHPADWGGGQTMPLKTSRPGNLSNGHWVGQKSTSLKKKKRYPG